MIGNKANRYLVANVDVGISLKCYYLKHFTINSVTQAFIA
jgi:hypothetical protein